MSGQSFTLFQTAIGWCGIAWNSRGVVGVQLPEQTETATRARLRRRYPNASEAPPPVQISRSIEGIATLLNGAGGDLSAIGLDMDGIPPRHQQIYAIARGIPAGATLTYGEIAARLGGDGDAREVGEAMGRNPFPIIVPCHRVLAAGGKLGGFSASGGVVTKLRLLEIEGARVGEAPTLFERLPLAMRPRQRS
jgi:methylated-DNA-[protein]-cysteine S-methyltransferase